jgi:glyoxylase-like metal-dependent hydrolase (beta-lactamase superfamily II)
MSRLLKHITIHNVREGEGQMPMSLALPGVTVQDLAALKEWYWSRELSLDPATAIFHLEVRSYLMQVDGLNILVDTCCGNDKVRSVPWADRLQSPYLQNLHRLGISPEDIHIVLCTHLHVDHVGWNTRLQNGQWVPTFPNARYVFGRRDYEFFSQQTHEAHHREAYLDSVLPIVSAGMADIVESDHRVHREIEDGIWLQEAFGHSAGCVVVNAQRGGAQAAFAGDVVHHPVQLVRPDTPFFADEDPTLACVTRQRLFSQWADSGAVVYPAHFPNEPAGRIHRTGKHFRYEFLATH